MFQLSTAIVPKAARCGSWYATLGRQIRIPGPRRSVCCGVHHRFLDGEQHHGRSAGETTTTTYETFEDGTPNTLPPDFITEPDSNTVTADEKEEELASFREKIASLSDNPAIDRLEIRQGHPGDVHIQNITDRQQISRWINVFQKATLSPEPTATLWGSQVVFLTFYAGDEACHALYVDDICYTIRLVGSRVDADSDHRVMLKIDADQNAVLEQMPEDEGFLY